MSSIIYNSKFDILEIPFGVLGANIGIVEDVQHVNKVEARRTVNGGLVIVQSPFAKKMRINVHASGSAIRFEGPFGSLALGQSLTLYSSRYITALIAPGGSSVVLSHVPVPGSRVIVEDRHGNSIPHTLAGSTITLTSAATVLVYIKFRPTIAVALTAHSGGANEIAGAQNWSATFEER